MEHRITIKSNPRVLIAFAIIVGLPAAGVASFLINPIVGAILTVVLGYFAYQIAKIIRGSLRSKIETSDEGVDVQTSANESISFSWSSVARAGTYRENGKDHLYLYGDAEDQLITCADEYTHFEELVARVEQGVGERFHRNEEIPSGGELKEYLRSIVAPDEDDETAQGETPDEVD